MLTKLCLACFPIYSLITTAS